MKVTIKFGVDNYVHESINAPTIGQLKENPTIRAVLGHGDNVRALVDGVEQTNSSLVADGSIVRFETAANSKATAILSIEVLVRVTG